MGNGLRVPLDDNGNPMQLGADIVTGSATTADGTGADDLTVPTGAIGFVGWATTNGFQFKTVSGGTFVEAGAGQVVTFGVKAVTTIYINQASGGSDTLYYYWIMGEDGSNAG